MHFTSSLRHKSSGLGVAFALTTTCVALTALCLSQTFQTSGRAAEARRAVTQDGRTAPRVLEDYGRLPLRFEANRGQTARGVKFLARGSGYTLLLSEAGATLRLRRDAPKGEGETVERAASADATLRIRLEGASRSPKVKGLEEMRGKSNYLVGSDARRWLTNVPVFAKVEYESVYPGVDMVYYGSEGRLEYDFRVAPGASAERVRLRFDGARSTRVEENGDLLITTDGGDVRQRKPLAYQEVGGARREVSARYSKDSRGAVRIELGEYDRTLPLVIDPVLVYSSYVGGQGFEQGLAVAVDSSGGAYVAGSSISPFIPGSTLQGPGGDMDAFVVKLSPDGKSFVYATYLGGDVDDWANAVAVDSAGNAYLAGPTASTNFPVTNGSFQTVKGGAFDVFVTKLDASGSALVYSTYFGGVGSDVAYKIALGPTGAAYISGRIESINFNGFPSATRAGTPAFKSADAGANWVSSASGLTASQVTDFAFAPNAPDTVYAGTNIGVFKSADAGATWQATALAPPASDAVFVTDVAVDPSNAAVVYAASATGAGVYKSTNGGASFDPKNNGLNVPIINTLAVDPSSPSTVYAGSPLGFFKTTNGGDSWVALNSGLPSPLNVFKMVVDPSNTQTVYAATNRGVLKSVNGGAVWSPANTGLAFDGFTPQVRALAIDPSHPSTLYAYPTAGNPGIHKTIDGGANWTLMNEGLGGSNGSLAPVNVLLVDPASSSTVYAGTTGLGLFRTTDGGANWAQSNTGLTNRIVIALGARADAPAFVLAGTSVGADAFAAKLNASGSQFEYVRVFGGIESEEARGLAVGADGSAYLGGTTVSSDFPLANAFQSTLKGIDAFVTKLGPTGSTVYSTYLGGTSTEQLSGVALGADGSANAVGTTFSFDFPLANALQPTRGDSLPLGEAFVTKLSPDGQSLAYSTYLGGDGHDQAFAVAVGTDGSAYVAGTTSSTNFPVAAASNSLGGNTDAFVTRINPSGSQLLFSTYFGGALNEQGNAVAVDSAGAIYLVGTTPSSDLPVANAAQPTRGGGTDGFVAKFGLDADLSLSNADSRDPVMVGNNLTYTLTVSNAGVDAAEGVVLTDVLPNGPSFVSANASQGTCAGTSTVTCNLGRIDANASATVTIVVTPQSTGNITNAASVTSTTPDHDASNNSASQQTRVSSLPSIAGRVRTGAGTGVAGVQMFLLGSQTSTATTGADGFYQFGDLAPGGNYHVTPSHPSYVFHPDSRDVTNLTSDVTADFTAVACVFQIAPRNASFTAAGGPGGLTVTAPDGLCPWTATSDVPWIQVTGNAQSAGTNVVSFNVSPTTVARRGTMRVAGHVFTVWQGVTPCDAPSFTTAGRIANSPVGFRVLTRDFNADGKPDLAVAGDHVINVLLNSGGGVFTNSANLNVAAGFHFNSHAAGDFNGDGRIDLASVSGGGFNGFVTLHLGDGAGNFGAPLDFNVGANPTIADTGDLNGDGRDDLVVGNNDPGNLSVLLGSASGFAPVKIVGAERSIPRPLSVALGDYNNDGKRDAAVLGSSGVAVALGDGAGGFGEPKFFGVGVFDDSHIAAGDVNADGALDLVVAGTNLVVRFGDGAGNFDTNFGATVVIPTGGSNSDVVVADLNGDGRRDVASTDFGTGDVPVALSVASGGFSPGGFSPMSRYVAGAAVRGLAAEDFDGDGKKDLAVVNGSVFLDSGEVFILKGDGAGGFRAARDFDVQNPFSVVTADFNSDGRLDLVTSSGSIFGGSVVFMPGLGGGAFGEAKLIGEVEGPRSIDARDFNHDGKPDLAVFELDSASGSKSRVKIFLSDGAGAFTLGGDTFLDTFNPFIAYADFNGDGNTDVVSGGPSFGVAFRAGDGAGHFAAPVALADSLVLGGLAAGDFNGDGKSDVVAKVSGSGGCGDAKLYVFQGDGAGHFAAPVVSAFAGSTFEMLPFDFNGDGRADLAAADTCNKKVDVLLSDGAGGFTSAGAFSAGPLPLRLALGDFNGDGKPDLAVSSGDVAAADSQLAVLTGDGVGGFSAPFTLFPGRFPSGMAVGDFDGNGRDDIAATGITLSNVAVFLNACPVSLSSSTVQFGASVFNAGEGAPAVNINVTRAGDTSGAATVKYSTQPGTASQRTDYTTAVGTLRFAPGETEKSFQVLLTDDALVEGSESLTLALAEPTGAGLGTPNAALLNIVDNETLAGPNPIDDSTFFVRQHYHDFLNREPDAAGLAFWVNEIESCGANAQCREVRRINVSAAFFKSIEFQETGYLVYKFYKSAYGDATSPGVAGTVPVIRLEEFLPDTQQIGAGVRVGIGDWQAQLEANKNAYALEFVQRARFTAAYPTTLTPTEFVDKLNTNAGGVLDATERTNLINELSANNTNAGRASVLRKVAEDSDLHSKEFNRAFVLMQYYGYMRRNPDDAPELTLNYAGWRFWLTKLEEFNGNFVRAEMVKAFITSDEYRHRFGQ